MLVHFLNQHFRGRKRWQGIFTYLHRWALIGMNYGQGDNIYEDGELEVIKYLLKLNQKHTGPVVFDVGANIGHYSSAIISLVGSKVQLYCFEPSAEAFSTLSQKLGSYEQVKLYNLALGDRNEIKTLHGVTPGSPLSSLYKRQLNHINREVTSEEQVTVTRLDEFCMTQDVSHIHLLKLDVEGNELNVLNGARKLLSSNAIDLIQFEFGGCNIDSRTYFRDFFYLLTPRYRIYRIIKDGFVPIKRYAEVLEIFTTTNYLAISDTL